jgi:hypothetical protein
VSVTRLLVKDSIEVRVLAVQEAKHALFAGADGAAEDTAGAPRRWVIVGLASSHCCLLHTPAHCRLVWAWHYLTAGTHVAAVPRCAAELATTVESAVGHEKLGEEDIEGLLHTV